jgi:hypothetical protein
MLPASTFFFGLSSVFFSRVLFVPTETTHIVWVVRLRCYEARIYRIVIAMP